MADGDITNQQLLESIKKMGARNTAVSIFVSVSISVYLIFIFNSFNNPPYDAWGTAIGAVFIGGIAGLICWAFLRSFKSDEEVNP